MRSINFLLTYLLTYSRIHVGVSVEFADVKRLTNRRWISVSFYSPNPAQPVINIKTRGPDPNHKLYRSA